MPILFAKKDLKSQITKALEAIKDPQNGQNIVKCGMVNGLQVSEKGEVIFLLEVDPARGQNLEPLRQQAEQTVHSIKGVTKVTAVLTAQKPQQNGSKPTDPHGVQKSQPLKPNIKNIIVIASGKGGVGKSTLATNLAVALAKNTNLSIGLLDADIYGPSQPRMMGLQGQKPEQINGKIQPPIAHNVKTMSIGLMMDEKSPLVWRGPLVQSALLQLIRDTNWGTENAPMDILIIDMPPGTGDIQLTLAQKVPLKGAVIISTPQDIALLDARKAIEMFNKTKTPILGLVENMSTHICSNCGHEDPIFGHGGAEAEAKERGLPFLGALPLSRDIRLNSDEGTPIAINSDRFDKIAENLINALKS